MALSDIVNISISTTTAKILAAGFGIPLILSSTPTWSERFRVYTTLAGMVTDGFTAFTPEYKAAAVLFSQAKRVTQVIVGRCANSPTQRFVITPVVTNLDVYTVYITSTAGVVSTVTYTADGTATAAEICTGLKTAIDLLGLALTVTAASTLTIAANAANTFWGVEVANPAKLGIVQNHADPGYAADLTAIALENSSWYAIISLFNSAASIAAIAAWAESNQKFYMAQSQDTDILGSGTGDIATTLKTAAYARSAVWYHGKTDAFADAGICGVNLPKDPGSEDWKFKTPAGLAAYRTALTATQRSNALGKNCNLFTVVGAVSISEEGKCADGGFIDVIRFRDWLIARISEAWFTRLANLDKIAFTDGGMNILNSDLKAVLQRGVDVGGLSSNPKPTTFFPLASSISSADKTARALTGVTFTATLAGAVHSATLAGTLSS